MLVTLGLGVPSAGLVSFGLGTYPETLPTTVLPPLTVIGLFPNIGVTSRSTRAGMVLGSARLAPRAVEDRATPPTATVVAPPILAGVVLLPAVSEPDPISTSATTVPSSPSVVVVYPQAEPVSNAPTIGHSKK